MGAKAILKRYIHRNSGLSPVAPSELREHLASVAERSRLKVTGAELDEIMEMGDRKPETGDKEADSAEWRRENLSQKAEAGKKGKTARNKKAAAKGGDSAKTEI